MKYVSPKCELSVIEAKDALSLCTIEYEVKTIIYESGNLTESSYEMII